MTCFVDGYDNAVSNRTIFPLNGGFFSLNSEHPQWSGTFLFHNHRRRNLRIFSAEVMLSTDQNPNTFNDFPANSLAKQPFMQSGEGIFCFPLNLSAAGITGVQDGANVTIQIEFNGGDGNLFQVSYCSERLVHD